MSDSSTDNDNVEVTGETVWYCPWCEIAMETEHDAYLHTYSHVDKAPYAFEVMDAFEQIPVVEVTSP